MALDPITIATLGGAAVQGLGSLFSARSARKAEMRAKRQERRRRTEMNRLRDIYADIDTSNPFLNMENTFEDLTVNQQAAEFQAQQFQQSQANVLNALRGSAGSSGIAALAQSLAQQGQLAAQRSSADIASQEQANQRLAAQQAASIQASERRGELISRQQQRDQTGTLLGIEQQRAAAARQQRINARKARLDAISGGLSGVIGTLTTGAEAGVFDNVFGGGSQPAIANTVIADSSGNYAGGTLGSILNPSIFQ